MKQLQQILLIRRFIAYLLVLRYVQALKDNYTYNNGNQLTDDRHNQYEYDKNSNLTKKTEWLDGKPKIHTYTYDYENRLIKVEIQKDNRLKTVTFTYDPFGRRLSKTVQREEIDNDDDDDRDYIRTTYYVYDNEDIIMEYNHKGKVTARYTHGLGIDEPLAIEQKGHTYYYHADGLGSIVALTDANQKVVQTYEYDSFGNLKDQKERIKQPYTFTAREWDKEIGLYFYRARYYDARVGRFTSFDPILHPTNRSSSCSQATSSFDSSLENPQKFNPFIYVENNSINMVDPYGETVSSALKTVIVKCATGAVAGAAIEAVIEYGKCCYDQCGGRIWECDFSNCELNLCNVAVSSMASCIASAAVPNAPVFPASWTLLKELLKKAGLNQVIKQFGRYGCK